MGELTHQSALPGEDPVGDYTHTKRNREIFAGSAPSLRSFRRDMASRVEVREVTSTRFVNTASGVPPALVADCPMQHFASDSGNFATCNRGKTA